jgi:hypothetical protein
MLKNNLDDLSLLDLAKTDDLVFNQVYEQHKEIALTSIASNSGYLTNQQKIDIENECPNIVYQAVQNYKPDRGMAFHSFVALCARWKCMESRSNFKEKMDGYYNICEYQLAQESNVDYQNSFYENMWRDWQEFLMSIKERDREIVNRRMSGATLHEAAEGLGISNERARQIQESCVRRFKKRYKYV